MIRSLSLAVPAAIISSLIGSANGFVLARWRFPGANLVFAFILFGMFIPYQAVMLPLRQTYQDLDVTRGVPTLLIAHVHLRHPDLHADLPQLLRDGRCRTRSSSRPGWTAPG